MGDILQLSLLPFRSRIQLLRVLLPLAFSSIEKTESWDNRSLTTITKPLGSETNAFFEAVCMLAFADNSENISLGEFARTIIRANPFKGGTSEFAYPAQGGYDSITKILADYVMKCDGKIFTKQRIQKIVIHDSKVEGIITGNGEFHKTNCVVVSYPAYAALKELFDPNVLEEKFLKKINRLEKTTSVIEVHFALNSKLDERHIVFPVGEKYITKGIFFISNITPSVSPSGEHLIIAGTPVESSIVGDSDKVKNIVDMMKKEISEIYPKFNSSLIWERPMAWKLVESVVKEPGMV